MFENVQIPTERYREETSLSDIANRVFDWKIGAAWLIAATVCSLAKQSVADLVVFTALSSTYYMAAATAWHKGIKPALRKTENTLSIRIPGLD